MAKIPHKLNLYNSPSHDFRLLPLNERVLFFYTNRKRVLVPPDPRHAPKPSSQPSIQTEKTQLSPSFTVGSYEEKTHGY